MLSYLCIAKWFWINPRIPVDLPGTSMVLGLHAPALTPQALIAQTLKKLSEEEKSGCFAILRSEKSEKLSDKYLPGDGQLTMSPTPFSTLRLFYIDR